MRKVSRIWFVVAFLSATSHAWAQGTLAQIAVGGGWQTTITLLNRSTLPTTAQVTLYSDSGGPLVVTPVGLTSNSLFSVSLPSNGSAVLVLPDVGSNTQGWASVVSLSGGAIGGQGTFLFHRQGGTDWEGAVPLTPATSNSLCIIALPPPQTTTTLLPFDNIAGAVAGIGIANLSNANQAITLEVDGQDGSVLQTDTLNLAPLNHTSFLLTDRYSSLTNQKGVLRLTAATGAVGLLGLRVGSTGGFSTLLPISQ